MPASKHRPRRLTGPTKTYNIIWPVETLEAIHAKAAEEGISPATFVRDCVDHALDTTHTWAEANTSPMPMPEPDPEPEQASKDYVEGVEDACAIVKKSPRLAVKMATGISMGEDMAIRIKKELGM